MVSLSLPLSFCRSPSGAHGPRPAVEKCLSHLSTSSRRCLGKSGGGRDKVIALWTHAATAELTNFSFSFFYFSFFINSQRDTLACHSQASESGFLNHFQSSGKILIGILECLFVASCSAAPTAPNSFDLRVCGDYVSRVLWVSRPHFHTSPPTSSL